VLPLIQHLKVLKLKTTLIILLIVAKSVVHSQTNDSLKIEKEFLSAVGNKTKTDSLEKALYDAYKGRFVLEDTYWYNLSKTRFLSGDINGAFEAADKGIKLCETESNEFKKAKFYNLEASVYAFRQENEKAISSFKKALVIVEKAGQLTMVANIQNNIANIFFGLSDYRSAYKYSLSAYNQLVKENDTVNLPGVTGILAISSLKIGKTKEGIELANKSISLALKYKNPIGLIVGYHSLGESYNSQKKFNDAITSLNESLKHSENYRQGHFIMLNKLALQHAYLMNKEYSKSIEYGMQAKEETKKLNNENTLYAIYKNLAYAYNELGDKTLAFEYMSKAHELYIASSGIQNQKAISEILIKYDTEKKEKDLVLSQLENEKNQNKLNQRMLWIILLLVLMVIGLLSYFYYNRLQKQRLIQFKIDQESKKMQATIAAEEKERERISNELHDGMASTITGIKMKLEDLSKDQTNPQLEPLVDQLTKLHEETRRMSHNLMPLGLNNENWADRLREYCIENSSKQFKISFSNNLSENISLDPSISVLLYRSVQELIHNAQKHSGSNQCVVQISKLENELIISIEDEGIGFDLIKSNGQGLTSLKQRLSKIGALLEIESKPEYGTLVSISLNLHK
jgi:signal transduction histidine kinase